MTVECNFIFEYEMTVECNFIFEYEGDLSCELKQYEPCDEERCLFQKILKSGGCHMPHPATGRCQWCGSIVQEVKD
jgi:hypothetical protein